MLIFVFTRAHLYTHKQIARWEGAPALRIWSYDRLLARRHLPRATYVLGDFDRLSPWELELAGIVARRLREGGARVLNDPARARQRFSLLRRLNEEGINDFNVFRLCEGPLPRRYPVFLRTASAHRGALTGLLVDEDALHREVARLTGAGTPLEELMAVEYAAEPIEGIFRKHAVFRVGGHMLTVLSAHEQTWMAKFGVHGLASDALYAEERAFIEDGRYNEPLARVFDIAEIDYGRADFGIVEGKPQIYEINTNPTMSRLESHPNSDRMDSDSVWREQYIEALDALDTVSSGEPIAMDDEVLRRQRRKDRLFFRARWIA